MKKIIIFSMIFIIIIGCVSLAPSTSFVKRVKVPGLGKPELILKNKKERPIWVYIKGPQILKLQIPPLQKRKLTLIPGVYEIEGKCSGAMPTTVITKLKPNHRYIIFFNLGLR